MEADPAEEEEGTCGTSVGRTAFGAAAVEIGDISSAGACEVEREAAETTTEEHAVAECRCTVVGCQHIEAECVHHTVHVGSTQEESAEIPATSPVAWVAAVYHHPEIRLDS